MLFTNVLATKEGSFNTLFKSINTFERIASAVKNFASCGKTPPSIKIVSTAKGKALVSTEIALISFLILTKGKSGSEIKR